MDLAALHSKPTISFDNSSSHITWILKYSTVSMKNNICLEGETIHIDNLISIMFFKMGVLQRSQECFYKKYCRRAADAR